jgi:23S rRNA pseudouridine1911/1915/1917 synthase
MTEHITKESKVADTMMGMRLDQVVAELFSEYSRSRLQAWIKSGDLTVDGKAWKTKTKVKGGELLRLVATLESETRWVAQEIPLNICYEDDDILLLNKPAGLVVHPAAGNPDGTLLNALLHYNPELAAIPRAGIVHRLDKDTSGLMVVAKTLPAHHDLVNQLQERSVNRQYEAIAVGVMTGGGTVDAPIGRHPSQRIKMAVVSGGKEAITHYRLVERFRGHTHIRVNLETGRTHQIRVHMAHIHYPLMGDGVYGGRLRHPKGASQPLLDALRGFKRQALHAGKIGLLHPATGELMEWEAEMPEDMRQIIQVLRTDANSQADT